MFETVTPLDETVGAASDVSSARPTNVIHICMVPCYSLTGM